MARLIAAVAGMLISQLFGERLAQNWRVSAGKVGIGVGLIGLTLFLLFSSLALLLATLFLLLTELKSYVLPTLVVACTALGLSLISGAAAVRAFRSR